LTKPYGPRPELNANGYAAREAFRKALALDSTMAQAHLGLAQIALAAGGTKEALAQAQQATDLKPDDPDSRVLLAQCYQANRQPDAAAKEMDAAVALDSRNVEVLTAAAMLHIFQKNLAKAEGYCQQAFELNQANDHAQALLASVLQAQGRLESARKLDNRDGRPSLLCYDKRPKEGHFTLNRAILWHATCSGRG